MAQMVPVIAQDSLSGVRVADSQEWAPAQTAGFTVKKQSLFTPTAQTCWGKPEV